MSRLQSTPKQQEAAKAPEKSPATSDERIVEMAKEIYIRGVITFGQSLTLAHQAEEAFTQAEAFFAVADARKEK